MTDLNFYARPEYAANESGGWVRVGRSGGPIMRSLSFMRIQRVPNGWLSWDVLRLPAIRQQYPTTVHRTLRDAKVRCEKIVETFGRESAEAT